MSRFRLLALLTALSCGNAAQAVELFAPGEESDPRLRSIAYLAGTQRNFSALSELLQMNPGGDYSKMPLDYQWLLAQAYLNFGMESKAEQVYRNIAQSPTDTATDADLMLRTRLRIAEFEYQRGYYAQARNSLYLMRENLPKKQIEPWQDLLSRVLMAEGRFNEALEVLTAPDNASRQSEYTRYNFAVALINTGETKKGRDVLDRVGRLRPVDLETLALRDRANLSLGWHFLKDNLAGSAKQVFYRVRGTGPYSNRALLGLGWAELDPKSSTSTRDIPEDLTPFSTFATIGGVLRPGFLNRESLESNIGQYKLDRISPEEEEALRRAMVAWVELIARDPLDPAVQEAWLAIPYSLDRLRAHAGALKFYEKAVEQLENNRQRLDVALASIKRGVMVETLVRRDIDAESGWDWKLKDLPDTPETYYLQNLLAEHRFQEALKNYRDVRLLGRSLDNWKTRLTTAEITHAARGQEQEPTEVLFKRAKQDWVEPWKDISITLREEQALSASGGATEAPLEAQATRPIALLLAHAPDRFNGAPERIAELKSRIANLRTLTATAGGQQAKLLERIATQELQGQKKVVEKYLIEARFALARLYDRELNKAAPEPVVEEERGSLLQRFLRVFGGGKK